MAKVATPGHNVTGHYIDFQVIKVNIHILLLTQADKVAGIGFFCTLFPVPGGGATRGRAIRLEI